MYFSPLIMENFTLKFLAKLQVSWLGGLGKYL